MGRRSLAMRIACLGAPVERLCRETRALRIYEGASEVQKVVIARAHLAGVSA